jgi:hypothetical protein
LELGTAEQDRQRIVIVADAVYPLGGLTGKRRPE